MTFLKNQKKMAAVVAHVGTDRVRLVPERAAEIKDAITKADIRALIKSGAIVIYSARSPSRARAKERQAQKKKSRRKGAGTRKGAKGARVGKKIVWMRKIRLIRRVLIHLKVNSKITPETYRNIYRKAKGGFFRDKGHVLFYLEQNKLLK